MSPPAKGYDRNFSLTMESPDLRRFKTQTVGELIGIKNKIIIPDAFGVFAWWVLHQ